MAKWTGFPRMISDSELARAVADHNALDGIAHPEKLAALLTACETFRNGKFSHTNQLQAAWDTWEAAYDAFRADQPGEVGP